MACIWAIVKATQFLRGNNNSDGGCSGCAIKDACNSPAKGKRRQKQDNIDCYR